MLENSWQLTGINAIIFQPATDREEVGVTDSINISHHPRTVQQFILNKCYRLGCFFKRRSELNVRTIVRVGKPMFKLPSGGPNGLGE